MNASSMHCTILTYDMQTYYCTHACTHTQVSHHSSQTRYQCSSGTEDTCHANTHTFGLLAYEFCFRSQKTVKGVGGPDLHPSAGVSGCWAPLLYKLLLRHADWTHTHMHAHTHMHMAAQCYALHALVIVHLQLAAASLFCSSSCRYGR